MAKRSKSAKEAIIDFTSIANHDSKSAKEGQVTLLTFDGITIRRVIFKGESFYSVVDVVGALAESESEDPGSYWRKLKERLVKIEESVQVVTDCHELKLPAKDGKKYRTDCANIETLFRIIQSIPSKKAEPFKEWLARVGFERIQEEVEPSRAARRAVQAYRDMGYPDDWIEERIQQAVADTLWDGEIGTRGVNAQGKAHIRSKVHEETMGITPKEHRVIKGVKDNSDLPDRMNNIELLLDRLAKTAGTEIMRARDTKIHADTRAAAINGAQIAGQARKSIEDQSGRSVITRGRELPKPD